MEVFSCDFFKYFNPLSNNTTKWPDTHCLSVFERFVDLMLKGLKAPVL